MRRSRSHTVARAFVALLLMSVFMSFHLAGLNAQEATYSSELERARVLEREIAELENRLVKAHRDWLTVSSRLEELEHEILDSYQELDKAELELEEARRELNRRLRSLYIEGRRATLIDVFSADDLADLLTRYHYAFNVAELEAEAFRSLKEKRALVKRRQERLLEARKETASLQGGEDTASIEAIIAEKKRQLAEINASLIASQPPATASRAPGDFNPNRVFYRPDPGGFVRTGQIMSGYASWYGNEFHGRPTASGEVFDQYSFTCAHKTLPFGTWLMVTYRGLSVIVRVNDRGPFVEGRFLDLSRGAAEVLGFTGVQWIDCEIVVPRGS
jgi:rare lipoprotein A (peptidoglycan hydrolase)